MKFTTLVALFAVVSAKKLPYDLDVPTMDAAIADAAHKNRLNKGAADAHSSATGTADAATATHSGASAANGAAASARGAAKGAFDSTDYHDGAAYAGAEATHKASVAAHEAATDAQNAADANEAANRARVAYEKDQFIRGQNQDRNKHLDEDDKANMSRIQDQHDQREGANARLKKALA